MVLRAQGGPGEAARVVTDALQAAGLAMVCDVSADGEFARLQVSDAAHAVVVDLAREEQPLAVPLDV